MSSEKIKKPIYNALQNAQNLYPLHMPGHKNKPLPYELNLQLDTTEHEDFDNLFFAENAIKKSLNLAKEYYKTVSTYYLVNGSSAGILTAIYANSCENDKILIARNCHISVYNAVEICGLTVDFITPEWDELNGFFTEISPLEVQKAFGKNSDVKLVVIPSPTYEGYVSDIEKIAEICHKNSALLIVDEAHGAHLHLYNEKLSALYAENSEGKINLNRADIVVQSLHKTLPALTSTALLHICNETINLKAIERTLTIFQTSSPSYILVASAEGCIEYIKNTGKADMARLQKNLEKVYSLNLNILKIVKTSDFTKVVLSTKDSDINALQLQKQLKDYGFRVEMTCTNYLLAMFSICDDEQIISKFVNTIVKIDAKLNSQIDKSREISGKNSINNIANLEIKMAMIIKNAKNTAQNCKVKNIPNCIGDICCEYIFAYPPAIPILIPGQIITAEIIDTIKKMKKSGVTLKSNSDMISQNQIMVI